MLAAVTERYSLFFLGRRSVESFRDSGVLPAFGGVVVSDRHANYFQQLGSTSPGNQACLAHLIRDFQDAAECYPQAIWPVRALRGLTGAWHAARDADQPAIPPDIAGPLIREFRHAVLAGLSNMLAFPGRSPRLPSPPAGTCRNSALAAKTTSCASTTTPGSGP